MAKVSDILNRKGQNVVNVGPHDSVMDTIRLMNEHRIGAVVVVENQKVIGIFSERDLLTRVVVKGLDSGKTRIGEVMSTPVAYCSPETEIAECRAVMTQKRIRHIPVVVDGRLAGMISIGDVMAWEISEHQNTIHYLSEYIYTR